MHGLHADLSDGCAQAPRADNRGDAAGVHGRRPRLDGDLLLLPRPHVRDVLSRVSTAREGHASGTLRDPDRQPEECVGCGLCEQACIHMPHAIRVVPNEELSSAATTARRDG